MRRFLAVLTLSAVLAPTLWARRVEGRVHSGSRLLSGIIVTDGVNFTKTGPEGTFRLDAADANTFISVVVPEGFTVPEAGFFQRLEGRRWFDFDLNPSFVSNDYSLIALYVPALGGEDSLGVFRREIMPALSDAALRLRIAGRTNALLFGRPSAEEFSELKKTKVPLYGVKSGGRMPDNYAFYLGSELIIISDNPSFIGGLIGNVSKDAALIIALSQPMYSMDDGGASIIEAVKGRKVDFISGYERRRHNTIFNDSIEEHVIPSLCGASWEDTRSSDGSPRGFSLFKRSPKGLEWQICNIGAAPDFQFEVITPGGNAKYPTELLVRAWDYDSKWEISWAQDGVQMGKMKEIEPGLLAATPGRYAKEAQIKVTDRFGAVRLADANLKEHPEMSESFSVRDKTEAQFYAEVFSAIGRGVSTLGFNLQLTSSGSVILCRDSYPRYSDAPGGILAADLIRKVEAYILGKGLSPRRYIFSVNSGSGVGEGKVWPEFRKFADACCNVLMDAGLGERLMVASFDDRLLNYLHSSRPDLELMYYIDVESGEYKDYMSLLDFKPNWLSIQYEILSPETAEKARKDGISIAVWDISSDEFAREARKAGADALIKD